MFADTEGPATVYSSMPRPRDSRAVTYGDGAYSVTSEMPHFASAGLLSMVPSKHKVRSLSAPMGLEL